MKALARPPVVEETPVRLLVIIRRDFSVLLTDVPGLTQSLLVVTLSRRVRQAEERVERMGGASAGYEMTAAPHVRTRGDNTLDVGRGS